MSGVTFLLGAAFLGIGVVRRFLSLWLSGAEQVLWGLVIGWSTATVVGYAFARIYGDLSFEVGLVITLLVCCAAIGFWLPTLIRLAANRGQRQDPVVRAKAFLPLALLLCLFAIVYFRLFNTHMLQVRANGGIYSGGESASYDMAFHAAVTSSFVYGANFPPIYTPMPPAPLLYPFLPDFLTALLVALGMDLHSALLWTAVPLCLALTGIFYYFARRTVETMVRGGVGEDRLDCVAATATLLFLLNGGFGFINLLQDWQTSGKGLWQFLSHLEVNYTHIANRGLVWPNVITDMLLPQRTSMFGLCLGFIVLTCFAIAWRKADDDNKWNAWQVLLVAGIITGALPCFHIHSYAAVGLISGFLFLLRPRRVWLVFWIPAVILALPRLVELGGSLTATGFTRFQPGWRGQGEQNWLLFWLRNIGLPTLLIIPAWLSASQSLRRFYLAFLALLVLALLVVFSPNDYDNLKVMTYWYAGTCVVIAAWLERLWTSRAGLVGSVVLIVVSTFSGALAIAYQWRASKLIFSRAEVAAAEFIKSGTAPHSLFLTAPSLLQPVLSLAGRAVVRGPTAWLWSHGYPFAEREADVRAIYQGRDDAPDLLRYYRVDYVYLGSRESADLRANRPYFDNNFPVVYHDGDIAIYDARKGDHEDFSRSKGYPPREYAVRVDRDPSQLFAEFPTIAFQLYRLHKVAFGSAPRYDDFVTDLRKVGRQVYVGRTGWRATLEQNNHALTDGWIAEPRFKERYDDLSNEGYVTALLRNAGLTPSDVDRTALVDALAAGRETRSSLLRRIASDGRLYAGEYNAAYVLCHYFSYLRRNPDDAPDHDLAGYNFWRAQLDRTGDYRGVTRAFIEADEYQQQVR
jgi:hypothetical protein